MVSIIPVIYTDKTVGRINASALEEMISLGKIAAYCQEDGWVHVHRNPILGKGGAHNDLECMQSRTDRAILPR